MLRRAPSLGPAAPAAALLLALSAPLAQAQNNDAGDAADSAHANIGRKVDKQLRNY